MTITTSDHGGYFIETDGFCLCNNNRNNIYKATIGTHWLLVGPMEATLAEAGGHISPRRG